MDQAFSFIEETFSQFEAVRQTGCCNMLDRNGVQAMADMLGFDNLVNVCADRKEYSALLVGYKAWVEEDPDRRLSPRAEDKEMFARDMKHVAP